MIIEIALGIVLAVLILAFWPVILGVGIVAIAVAIVAIVAIAVLALAFGYAKSVSEVVVVATIAAIPFAVAVFLNRRDSEARKRLRRDKGYK